MGEGEAETKKGAKETAKSPSSVRASLAWRWGHPLSHARDGGS